MTLDGRIQGIIPPLATPFAPDGELDLDALRVKVHTALAAGVHTLTTITAGRRERRAELESLTQCVR